METRETDHPAPPRSGPSYTSYLKLDELLKCQAPLSDTHDEMLFIVIHQASELWLKLCLHELDAARAAIAADQLDTAFKMMARVARIQQQLIGSWEILATITPADYSAMRHALGGSSGFQSHQYRAMEYLMGNKNEAMIGVFADAPHLQAVLADALHAPSIYDEALRALARAGLPVPEDRLTRDFTKPYETSAQVEACWGDVYAAPERYWDLYELAEKLVDLEYRFQLWRFGHLKTVERVIGFKRGTGGTAGVPYLAKVIDQVFFPELLTVRAVL
ncbi:tryptophan 2,3-dioxygenase [Sphingomonas radiodurans]|uniref:tryptophan 2,3-dioxygenase n=1 Tax=Sphingomonas radiodurans TaxID=2890321 RepID=UPI001E5039B9|nr:tryptophan 2,3-dioxygenase family protein [Sphingomonas radiodurans]WBH17677.1 tryptophan 2,3-dioxygenase family protein [Sphingomonas radiodurans]